MANDHGETRKGTTMIPTASQVVEKLPRFFRRHKLVTGWMRLTGENPVQLVRIRDDYFGYADLSDGFLRLIVIDRGFEADFFTIADAILAGGGVFLDVGANYGRLSFGLGGRHDGSIDFHLFEPNPALAIAIRRTLALYPQMKCTLNEVAVTDRPGPVEFSINERQTGVSHVVEYGELKVPAVTLDAYLDEKAIPCVSLVKMDIEGYELRACMGAEASLRSRRIQALYFEYAEKHLIRVSEPAKVIAFLNSAGFTTCFCRASDYAPRSGASHTLAEGLRGHGLPLLPVQGHTRPPETDLLAVPHEHLIPLAG
jgi:FkbM family methyltransferase